MWKELLKGVENTNVVDGISCGRYWSLIICYVYEKEGIQESVDEPKAEYTKYHFPKSVEYDEEEFPSVARIPDAMLKMIDPSNPVLVAYLKTINPSIETGVLLPRFDEGSSKQSRKSKKEVDASPSKVVTKKKTDKSPKKVEKRVEVTKAGPSMELIPSKSGVLKLLKKLTNKSKSSSEEHSPLV